MFGFLYTPHKNCGTRITSLYQSLFCGLSCQLHNDFGAFSRFLVNRDSTFLALVGDAVSDTVSPSELKTCCNPFAQKRSISSDSLSLQYSSAVTVCALSTKLEDNLSDESGLKKVIALLGNKAISTAKDKAIATLNSVHFPTLSVVDSMRSQNQIESSNPNLYQASEPTAFSFATIFAHQATMHSQDMLYDPLFKFGHSLGRLIYWRDAIDDLEKDKTSGSFNLLNYTKRSTISEAAATEFASIQSLGNKIPWKRHSEAINSIINHTTNHHSDMMSTSTKPKKRKTRSKSKWYDVCDCPCDCCSSSKSSCPISCCDDCGSCGCDCG